MLDRLPPPAPGLNNPRFLVTDARAIRQLLREMVNRACPLSVQPADSSYVAASQVLAVHDDGSLVLDASGNEAANLRLAQASALHCHGELDQVRVQFVLDRPRVVREGNGIAFRASCPERLYHEQRREMYRLKTPIQ